MNEKELNTKVRPVGIIRANKSNKAHIHSIVIKECGSRSIPYVMNASTVLLYNPTLNIDQMLASIDVLKRDVKLRLQSETPTHGIADFDGSRSRVQKAKHSKSEKAAEQARNHIPAALGPSTHMEVK